MICEIKVNNCFAYNQEVTFSLHANMKTKKFLSNIYSTTNNNVLKSACVYGPNNTGKSCLIKVINNIKKILLNNDNNLESNIFNKSNICDLEISFLLNDILYKYHIKYDSLNKEYLYERFVKVEFYETNNKKEVVYFEKDKIKNEYDSIDEDLKEVLKISSKGNILIYNLDVDSFPLLKEIKSLLINLANKIEIVSMHNIPMQKTIDYMKLNNKTTTKIVNFIKNSDLHLEDFKYEDDNNLLDEVRIEEIPLIYQNSLEPLNLVSTYKGQKMQSALFDSTGTKKIIAISSYIIEAIENDKILIIDELDSSLHFKLTRSIVSMFNNDLNKCSQLIFTTHDINLLDIKKLFRKEQIWFTSKDKNNLYLYSLIEFDDDKIIDNNDLIEMYRKGVFGSIPNPSFINSLLEISDEKQSS